MVAHVGFAFIRQRLRRTRYSSSPLPVSKALPVSIRGLALSVQKSRSQRSNCDRLYFGHSDCSFLEIRLRKSDQKKRKSEESAGERLKRHRNDNFVCFGNGLNCVPEVADNPHKAIPAPTPPWHRVCPLAHYVRITPTHAINPIVVHVLYVFWGSSLRAKPNAKALHLTQQLILRKQLNRSATRWPIRLY